MANTHSTLTGLFSDIADAIRGKTGGTEPIVADKFPEAIAEIPTDSDVKFFDYDGTILHRYSAEQFLALTAMPDNPSHEGLVAQGWNWSFEDAQEFVATNGVLNVGQTYITESGATEIDIELPEGRTSPCLGLAISGTVDIDWGDGTAVESVSGSSFTTRINTQHNYAAAGEYTISIYVGSGSVAIYGSATLQRQAAILWANIPNSTYSLNRIYQTAIKAVRIGANTEISVDAFSYCKEIKTITIPNDAAVGSIGTNAFYYCSNLFSIVLPSGVKVINANAAQFCYALKSVVMPNSVTTIADSAFSNCTLLSEAILPKSVTRMGGSVFSGTSLQKIVIPEGNLVSMGTYAFSNIYTAKSISLPASLTTISENAFSTCRTIEKINIGPNIKSIGGSAFRGCYGLRNVTMQNGITTIGKYAFADASIRELELPDSITEIGDYAFSGLQNLSKLHLSHSLTTIGNYAFSNALSLAVVIIPINVSSIGTTAFQNCYGMKEYHLLPTTPPTLANTNAFSGIPSDCIIYVPQGCLEAYQSATNWSTYASYMQEEPT